MKKLFILITMLLFIPMSTYALNIDDYFIINEESSVNEAVDHSVFAFGNNVSSDSEVNGILFAGANNININGSSDYGVIFGNNVKIDGNIENDLYVFGETVTIKGEINKDLYVFGNNVKIDTTVSGNVFAYAQNLNLENAKINGFVLTAATTISVSDNTEIDSVIKYNDDAIIKNGGSNTMPSNIKVETYKTANNAEIKKENTIATTIFSFFSSYLSRIAVTFLIVGILTKLYKYIVRKSRNGKRAFIESLWGFVILVMTPMAFMIILLTMIGVKLAFILLLGYVLMLLLANEITMIFIGNRIYTRVFKQKDNKFLSSLIGVTVISVLSLIPYIGGLVIFVSLILGLGILLDMGIAAVKYCYKEK